MLNCCCISNVMLIERENIFFKLSCCRLYLLGSGTNSDGIQNYPHWLTGVRLNDLWGSLPTRTFCQSVNLCSDFWSLGRGMVLAPALIHAGHKSSLSSVSPWQCPGWLQLRGRQGQALLGLPSNSNYPPSPAQQFP